MDEQSIPIQTYEYTRSFPHRSPIDTSARFSDDEEDDFFRYGEWKERRHGDELKLSSKQRRAMLLRRRKREQRERQRKENAVDGSDSGYSPEELQAAMMELYKIQKLRRQSLNDCPAMEGMLLLSESMYKASKAVVLSPIRLLGGRGKRRKLSRQQFQ